MAANAKSGPAARQKPIMLVGLMGAGKSSIGRRLAKQLARDFTDSDEEIVEAAGMEISEIFETYGEPHFRAGERRVLARLIEEESGVIATGGGAFMNDETRALMLDRGIVVWLDAELDTLVARVSRRSNRPLLVGKDPADVLAKLAKERGPTYAKAHIRVESAAVPIEETVDAILAALRDYENGTPA